MGVDPFIKIYPNYNLLLLIIDAGLSGLSVDLFLLFPKRIERENIDGVDPGKRETKRCYQQEERKGGRRDFTSKKRELVKKRCYQQEERDREREKHWRKFLPAALVPSCKVFCEQPLKPNYN